MTRKEADDCPHNCPLEKGESKASARTEELWNRGQVREKQEDPKQGNSESEVRYGFNADRNVYTSRNGEEDAACGGDDCKEATHETA